MFGKEYTLAVSRLLSRNEGRTLGWEKNQNSAELLAKVASELLTIGSQKARRSSSSGRGDDGFTRQQPDGVTHGRECLNRAQPPALARERGQDRIIRRK
jgi:hypothetical protein